MWKDKAFQWIYEEIFTSMQSSIFSQPLKSFPSFTLNISTTQHLCEKFVCLNCPIQGFVLFCVTELCRSSWNTQNDDKIKFENSSSTLVPCCQTCSEMIWHKNVAAPHPPGLTVGVSRGEEVI